MKTTNVPIGRDGAVAIQRIASLAAAHACGCDSNISEESVHPASRHQMSCSVTSFYVELQYCNALAKHVREALSPDGEESACG